MVTSEHKWISQDTYTVSYDDGADECVGLSSRKFHILDGEENEYAASSVVASAATATKKDPSNNDRLPTMDEDEEEGAENPSSLLSQITVGTKVSIYWLGDDTYYVSGESSFFSN